MNSIIKKVNNKKFTCLKNLQLIYGIGYSRALRFHKKLGLNLRLSSNFIKKSHKKVILYFLNKLIIDQKLLKYLKNIYNFAYNLRSQRGIRNRLGLPSRGQQTRTKPKTKKKLKL